MKARILLKADACEAGEVLEDSQIASALATTVNTVARPASDWWKKGSRRP